jgi:hypothetical protein
MLLEETAPHLIQMLHLNLRQGDERGDERGGGKRCKEMSSDQEVRQGKATHSYHTFIHIDGRVVDEAELLILRRGLGNKQITDRVLLRGSIV